MPGRPHHSEKWHSCWEKVQAQGYTEGEAAAICTKQLGEESYVAAEEADIRELHLLGATGTVRAEMYQGREHLVVPVVALMEAVIHAVNADEPEFVPFECLNEAPSDWNGKPVVLGHPTKDGIQISANDPKVLEEYQIGTIFQAHTKTYEKRLCMEAWIDPKRLEDLKQLELLEDVRSGKPIEVSVGAFVRTLAKIGEHAGKQFKKAWRSLKSDHLAFLPKGRGACSIEMGCGAHRAAQHYEVTDEGLLSLGPMGDKAQVDANKKTKCTYCDGSGSIEGKKCEHCGGKGYHMRAAGGPGSGWFAEGGHVSGSQGGSAKGSDASGHRAVSSKLSGAADKLQEAVTSGDDSKIDDAVKQAKAALKASRATGAKPYAVQAASSYLKKARTGHASMKAERLSEAVRMMRSGAKDHQAAAAWATPPKRRSLMERIKGLIGDEKGKDVLAELEEELKVEESYEEDECALEDQMMKMEMAVRKTFPSSGLYPSDVWPMKTYDTYVIIRKADKLFKVPYEWKDEEIVLNIEDSEEVVKEEKYVAAIAKKAAYDDCPTCDGSGEKDGNPCPTCDGKGEVVKAAEAANSDGGTSAEGDTMTRETRKELIEELVACSCSGFTKADIKLLENTQLISDERLEQFKAATEARKAEVADKQKFENELRTAEVKIKALEQQVKDAKKPLSEKEWMDSAPQSVRTLLERQQQADETKKAELVEGLKTAQEAYSEEELKAMEIKDLEKLAKVVGLGEHPIVDYSVARGVPRAATAASDVFLNPPNPYDEALKARREGKEKPSVQ